MIVTFKKFKSADRIIKYIIAACVALVFYAGYVAYMTFVVNSTLPFARYEELVVIGVLEVLLLIIVFLRKRYLKYKNSR